MHSLLASIQDQFWIIQIFLIILITATLNAISKRVIACLVVKAEKGKKIYYEAFLKAAHKPVVFIIWLLGVGVAAQHLTTLAVEINLIHYIQLVKKIGVIWALGWGLISFIRYAETFYIEKSENEQRDIDLTLINAVAQLLRVFIIVTALLSAMQIMGLPITGLLAFGGIGGAGVAFASKDLLANFFGSLVIYMDRPFKVGDWIRSPDQDIEGTVQYIGWRVTRILTFDRRPLYVPNGVFLTISVENPSRMRNRRIKTYVGIRYEDADKMDEISREIKAMLETHPEIDQKQLIIVNFAEFGPSSLNILIYTFTRTTNWLKFQEVQHDVFLKIIKIIQDYGADCAFPTQTLHIAESKIPNNKWKASKNMAYTEGERL